MVVTLPLAVQHSNSVYVYAITCFPSPPPLPSPPLPPSPLSHISSPHMKHRHICWESHS